MNKKKILFYVQYLGCGGVSVALRNVIDCLEEAGFKCGVILPYKEFLEHKLLFSVVPSKYFETAAWDKPTVWGNEGRHAGFMRFFFKVFNIFTGWKFYFYSARKIPHDVFVVFHVLGSEHWVRYSDRPTIGWLHGKVRLRKGFGTFFSNLIRSRMLNRFNELIAVSDDVSNAWSSAYHLKSKPTTLLNILNIDDIVCKGNEVQHELTHGSRKNLIFCGRMSHEKGLLRLLKCLTRLLRNDRVAFDLWVIGNGGWYTEEKDINLFLDRNQDMKDCVHILGYRDNPYKYMKAADLLIVPSYEEGFGLVIWESLLMRCPVLATDAGGCAEALRHGEWGRLVSNSDDAIYGGLKEYFQNPETVMPKCGFDLIHRSIRDANNHSKSRLVNVFNKLAN